MWNVIQTEPDPRAEQKCFSSGPRQREKVISWGPRGVTNIQPTSMGTDAETGKKICCDGNLKEPHLFSGAGGSGPMDFGSGGRRLV